MGLISTLLSFSSPSPGEFVTYLLDFISSRGPEQLDLNFQPFWAVCPFCSLDFDLIGRVESFNNDADFVFRELRLLVSFFFASFKMK